MLYYFGGDSYDCYKLDLKNMIWTKLISYKEKLKNNLDSWCGGVFYDPKYHEFLIIY